RSNLVQLNGSAAGGGLNAPLNVIGSNHAAIGLCPHGRDLDGNANLKINGAPAVMLSLAANHAALRSVAGGNLQAAEFAPGAFFRTGPHALAHNVSNIILRAALDLN